MINIYKTEEAKQNGGPLAILEVSYPPRESWRVEEFHAMVDEHLADLKEKHSDYDRKSLFGENPYFRYFKKFKKTYPVMQQFESVLFKDRPFPKFNPVTEIPFLAELETQALMGSHDADQTVGPIQVYLGQAKDPFPGMRGDEVHTYPGDLCARDDQGIILSMIAGADQRTFVRPDSLHVFHPVFGTPGQDRSELEGYLDLLAGYVSLLSPEAEIQRIML